MSLEPGLNTMREARCRTHLDGDGFGAAHTRQHVNFKRAHFRSPASNTTKITREDPEEREERKKMLVEEGKKSVKFWAPHSSGPHNSRPHFSRFAAPPFGEPNFGAPPFGCRPASPPHKHGLFDCQTIALSFDETVLG